MPTFLVDGNPYKVSIISPFSARQPNHYDWLSYNAKKVCSPGTDYVEANTFAIRMQKLTQKKRIPRNHSNQVQYPCQANP